MAEVYYPVAKFRFKVTWDKQPPSQEENIGFTEVSGLDYSIDPIEYRDGRDPNYSKKIIAGMRKFSHVTFKRGVFTPGGNGDFNAWMDGANPNSIRTRGDYRRTVTITLLSEAAVEIVTWTLQNAFPVKVQYNDMKADGNEVAIETLELAHEGVTVKYL